MASENQKCSEETTIFVQTQTGSQINGFSWRKKKNLNKELSLVFNQTYTLYKTASDCF